MNKQQLAKRIWESANKMRSKIEADKYKDYILGFIFYKFLSDKEIEYLKNKLKWTDEDLVDLSEDEEDTVRSCQNNLGYFISYNNLFSTWIKMKKDFSIVNVTEGISAFNRLIGPRHKKVYKDIFHTLESQLIDLGDSDSNRTKAISKLLNLIKDVPMDSKQDYDVLGFIYEYLLSNFAANAGKKAGEFYTPHEVSVFMSEIVAHHLKNRADGRIDIYDPTSGSGSLLINIGKAVARYTSKPNGIKYYAQELKTPTYNLTRMNLVMRGVLPDNIFVRNGDTLAEDWPYFDEDNNYEPLYVDAVISNPPYSQHWDREDYTSDIRYEYGLAPKTKADLAFLLHDLYHLKNDGIMAIVLPHGVLFRGGDEESIRTKLVENNHIEAIIGLPPNIFFGTSIATIVMILRKDRKGNGDILIVDASKGFIKDSKKNRLRARDIKKIVDTVVNRSNIHKYARVVSKQEVRDNLYNLNIPRYVDASDSEEEWDLYATMNGGIPNEEIDKLESFWKVLDGLRGRVFTSVNEKYSTFSTNDIKSLVNNDSSVICYNKGYAARFDDYATYLSEEIISNFEKIVIPMEEAIISEELRTRMYGEMLVDYYDVYQILDDYWKIIANDLEMLQTEGLDAARKIDPNIIADKDGNEKQDGWVGRILPLDMVKRIKFPTEISEINNLAMRLSQIDSECKAIIDDFSEEEKEGDYINEAGTSFVYGETKKAVSEILDSVENKEIKCLCEYLRLIDGHGSKKEKIEFVKSNPIVNWSLVDSSKDGTYSKSKVKLYIQKLRLEYQFEDGTFEAGIIQALKLLEEEKVINKRLREINSDIESKIGNVYEHLSDNDIKEFLKTKWICPLAYSIQHSNTDIISLLVDKLEYLRDKYQKTLVEIDSQITFLENRVAELIGDLSGNDYDRNAIKELQKIFRGM